MNSIKSATRSAGVAFAPEAPFLASGTLAGGVDLLEKLEIFKLDFQSNERDLPVVGECISNEGFNRLSWGNAGAGTEEYAFGLIAGGMSDVIINVWNPAKMMRWVLIGLKSWMKSFKNHLMECFDTKISHGRNMFFKAQTYFQLGLSLID